MINFKICVSCPLQLSSKATAIDNALVLLPLDEAIAYRAVFVIVSGSDGRADGKAFEAAK